MTLAAAQPRSYWVQMALGRALRKAGDADPDAATRAFEAAASLVPISPAPRNELAQIALEKKDRTRAIAELQALVATDFDNVDAARGAGVADAPGQHHRRGQVRAVNERIVAIDPFDGEAHTILGRLAMDRNDFEAATRDFKVALALNPIDRAAAHTDLAASYLKSGKTGRRQEADAGGARDRAELRAARRSCCWSWWRRRSECPRRAASPLDFARGDPEPVEGSRGPPRRHLHRAGPASTGRW